MVAPDNPPPGGQCPRQVGLFHHLWLAGFLLVCSLVAFQPGSLRSSGIPSELQEIYWLYRRDGGSHSSRDPAAEVLVTGDIMLGRGVARVDDPFLRVGHLLTSVDLAVGNFEGVISSQESITETSKNQSGSVPYRLVAPIRTAIQLHTAGFDLLSLANNHSLDLGRYGLEETIGRLARIGIKTTGVGNNLETAYRPVILDVKDVSIAFLAIDAIPEPLSMGQTGHELQRATWNKERVLATLHQLDLVSDVIIVLIHWGDEYEVRAGPNQRQAALEMVEAGADVVIGSHPHVVQETQILAKSGQNKVGFVAYSLGNFVFDQFEENSRIGLALKIIVDAMGLKAVVAVPVHAGPQPELLASAESQKLIERIRPEPAWSGFQCDLTACFPVQTTLRGGYGRFKAGQIDLNGDGIPETVRLEHGRVDIFEGDRLGWQSPQEWQVLDVALGDPNDDGRGEAMLVLQKPDKDGKLASHPFMIGHRGGIYRLVWGGSAVALPIHEVELADVDTDGKQELIVLEQQPDGVKTIAMLKWDDWVFRLFWRSSRGRFVDLQIRKLEKARR